MALLTIIWEVFNKEGKWCAYSGEVCHLLENAYQKKLLSVRLGDADPHLNTCVVKFKEMLQVSEIPATKLNVRRRLCDEGSSIASAILWQWRGDYHHSWHCYNADIADIIEKSFQSGQNEVDLSNYFINYPYKLCLLSMTQKNKKTKYHRPIRRIISSPYPVLKVENGPSGCEMSITANGATAAESDTDSEKLPQKKSLMQHVNSFWNKFVKHDSDSYSSSEDSPKNSGNKKQCTLRTSGDYENFSTIANIYPDVSVEEISPENFAVNDPTSNVYGGEIIFATVNGKPWMHPVPPHTPQSQLKPVPGIDPLHSDTSKSTRKGKKKRVIATASMDIDVMTQFTVVVPLPPSKEGDEEQMCNICFELLSNGSSYDDDKTLIKLTLCSHVYHKSCIQAMYDCGAKDNCLQCPTCKTIHGVKCGIQPPGDMVYHVIPCSLPGYPECETIRILYYISSGIQGPEHPNPGRKYTARGFPRVCYLPDNDMGRKVLRLLITAWERRLIFTIGTSSTTGEQNTVTWNEIHHKTEFSYNRRGHGYPDPNYFLNVIAELAAHGVTESAVQGVAESTAEDIADPSCSSGLT